MGPPVYRVELGEGEPVHLMSDLHIGSRDCNYEQLRADIEAVRSAGGQVFINGDVWDAILPTDKRHDTAGLVEPRNDIVNCLVEEAFNLLKPIASQIRLVGVGNHEYTVSMRYHVDLAKLLIHYLYRESGNNPIYYGGYHGFVRLVVPEYRTRRRNASFVLYYHHGYGGSPKSGTKLTLQELRTRAIADIYWIGHKHQTAIYSEQVMVPNRLFATYQDVWLVSTGCYLRPGEDRDQSYVGWHVRRGYLTSPGRQVVSFSVQDGLVRFQL